jgi:hypothetical protein
LLNQGETNMKIHVVITCALLIGATSVMAGAKEDFISAVKEASCSGEVKATGGRQGSVMKWKTCTSSSVTIDGCTITCKDASSSIGG